MPPIRDLLWGLGYPALAAGCTWAFLGGGWFRRDARWVSSLAVAAAFVLADIGLFQGPPMEPTAAREWLVWIAFAGALISPLEALHARARFPVRAGFVGALVFLLLRRQYENHWEGEGGLAGPFPEVGIALLLALGGWYAVERIARIRPGAGAPLVLWATASALAVCCLWSSSGSYAQLAGALAAAMGAAVVLSWLRPGAWFAGGGAGLAWLLCFGVGLSAHFYARLDATDALLLASAPFVALLADLLPRDKRESATGTLARLLIVLLPLAAASVRCYQDYAALDQADPYGSPSSYGGYGG